jgi:hypothetical protein
VQLFVEVKVFPTKAVGRQPYVEKQYYPGNYVSHFEGIATAIIGAIA